MIDLDALDAEAERAARLKGAAAGPGGPQPAVIAPQAVNMPATPQPQPEAGVVTTAVATQQAESVVAAAHPQPQPLITRRLPRALPPPAKKAKAKT